MSDTGAQNEIASALLNAGFAEEANLISEEAEVKNQSKSKGVTFNEKPEQKENERETFENKQETEETLLTDFEKEQQAKGWNPTGEKSAEEWLRAQPLYEEIKQRGKEIKQLKRTVDSLKEVMDKQKKLAYDQAILDLENRRANAEVIGDVYQAQHIQQEIENTKQEAEAAPELPQEAYDFAERNASWMKGTTYEEMEIARFAKERDNELAIKNLDPVTHITTLEEHLHKKFPDYFGINVKPESQLVESSSSSGVFVNTNKKKYTINDLNPAQKKVIYDFERSGIITQDGARNTMTRDEYIKILSESGDLK